MSSAFFSHIVEQNPEARSAQYNLSREYHRLGRLDEAREAARIAVQQRPEFSSAHNMIGMTHLDRDEHEEARPHFERAIELNPRDGVAMQNLGEVYRNLRQCEKAIQIYGQVPDLNPTVSALARAGIGYCLFDLGRYHDLVQHTGEALGLHPELRQSQPYLLFLTGWALHRTGRP